MLPAMMQDPAFDSVRDRASFRGLACRLELPSCEAP